MTTVYNQLTGGRRLMVKNLRPGLTEVGKIKIGEKGRMITSQRGKEFQPPQKLDHFRITTRFFAVHNSRRIICEVQIADEDHGQGPHDDHRPLAHAIDKREAETERSRGRNDDNGPDALALLD